MTYPGVRCGPLLTKEILKRIESSTATKSDCVSSIKYLFFEININVQELSYWCPFFQSYPQLLFVGFAVRV